MVEEQKYVWEVFEEDEDLFAKYFDEGAKFVNTYEKDAWKEQELKLKGLGVEPTEEEREAEIAAIPEVRDQADPFTFDSNNILYYAYDEEKSWIFRINLDDGTSEREEISNLAQRQLPAGHQILQMPETNKIYVSGGIGQNNKFYEIVRNEDTGTYTQEDRMNLRFPREFHSMCFLNPQTLYFTGSRFDDRANKVELYTFVTNKRATGPDLKTGRCRHSSLGFACRWLYVFGGFGGGKALKSIERLAIEPTNGLPKTETK